VAPPTHRRTLDEGDRASAPPGGCGCSAGVRGVELIAKAVTEDGPLTREQLRQRLGTSGVPTAGQALVHLLGAASSQGAVLRGPMVGTEHAFVAVDQWLGPAPPALDREEALTTLARRYLVGHAPGRPEDLAKWTGITLGDAPDGFATIGDEYVSVDEGLLAPGALADTPMPAPRLLGAFDPLLHGWVSREPFVGRHSGVVTTNGIFRPVALVDGRVVATWGLPVGRPTVVPWSGFPPGSCEPSRRRARTSCGFLECPRAHAFRLTVGSARCRIGQVLGCPQRRVNHGPPRRLA
jgi:hypothetical protein